MADFEAYLVKQRGLGPRSIPHSVGLARRFLDYRFGEAVPDVGRLRRADVIGFMEHVLASARRDKTVATLHISVRARRDCDQSGTERSEDGETL